MKKIQQNEMKNYSSEDSVPRKNIGFSDVVMSESKWCEKKQTRCLQPTSIAMENLELFVHTDDFKHNPFCLHGLNQNDSLMDLLSYAIAVQDLDAVELVFSHYQNYEKEKEDEFKQGKFVIKYELTLHPLHTLIEHKNAYPSDVFDRLFIRFVNWLPENIWEVKSHMNDDLRTIEVLSGVHSDGLADFIMSDASQEQFEMLFENLKMSSELLGSQHQCAPKDIGVKVFRRLFEQTALCNHLPGFTKVHEKFLSTIEGAEHVFLEEENKSLILAVGLHAAIQQLNLNAEANYKFIEQLVNMKVKKGQDLEKLYAQFPEDTISFIENAQMKAIVRNQVKAVPEFKKGLNVNSPGRF